MATNPKVNALCQMAEKERPALCKMVGWTGWWDGSVASPDHLAEVVRQGSLQMLELLNELPTKVRVNEAEYVLSYKPVALSLLPPADAEAIRTWQGFKSDAVKYASLGDEDIPLGSRNEIAVWIDEVADFISARALFRQKQKN